jgi:hypothetical protein
MKWHQRACPIGSCAVVLLLVVKLSTLAIALDPPVTSDSFVGTWQAQFQGKTFVTIKLTKQDTTLTGTISHSTVQLDNSGELTSAEQKDGEDPVSGASLQGSTLHLTSKNQDSQDTIQYEMTLTGSDQAELQILGAPTDGAAPKPWKLVRVSAAAAAAQSRSQDIKAKLAAAAQTWLSGQFGTGTSTSAAGSTALPGASTTSTTTSAGTALLKISDATLDATLRKSIDGLPRRVHDRFNNQGDMVNFVLIGTEQQVQSALKAATWHLADRDDKLAVLNAIEQTYQSEDYLAMPMSTLYLFDRPQDFGYEEADPYAVVATRHHFRLWKAPFTWNGQTVWAGAGTHDIGFEKDQRNGKVTHKIDPAVDGERDNIGATLQKAGKTKTINYYLPPDPVQDAKNATGGGYHSDGRLLVVMLQ